MTAAAVGNLKAARITGSRHHYSRRKEAALARKKEWGEKEREREREREKEKERE